MTDEIAPLEEPISINWQQEGFAMLVARFNQPKTLPPVTLGFFLTNADAERERNKRADDLIGFEISIVPAHLMFSF